MVLCFAGFKWKRARAEPKQKSADPESLVVKPMDHPRYLNLSSLIHKEWKFSLLKTLIKGSTRKVVY
jgi:hypothetical protein